MTSTNDDKIREYNQERVKKWIIVILSLIVVVLEILAILGIISMLWGILVYILINILKKVF